MAMLPLGLAPKTIKYLMFAFNLLFVIAAIALLSATIGTTVMYEMNHEFLSETFFSVSYLFITVGSIIFIIAFLGCCGAGRESYPMIVTFCTILVGIFVLEIVGVIMGYVMRANIKSTAEHKMFDTMAMYNNSREIAYIWDELQRNFGCCGSLNATDWLNMHYSGIPMSCCNDPVGVIGNWNCTLESPNFHKVGCLNAFANFADRHAGKIAGVGMGLGVIELIGIFLSAYLAKSIRNCYQTM